MLSLPCLPSRIIRLIALIIKLIFGKGVASLGLRVFWDSFFRLSCLANVRLCRTNAEQIFVGFSADYSAADNAAVLIVEYGRLSGRHSLYGLIKNDLYLAAA